MADTGKQSPLGVNVHGSYLNDIGLNINPTASGYMGSSKNNNTYTFGSIVQDTCLRLLTWAIHDGYNRGDPGPGGTRVPTLTDTTYNNLISIGQGTLPGLGNSIPPTYLPTDPAGVWTDTAVKYGKQHATDGGYDPDDVLPGPATSGYGNNDPETGNSLQGYGITDQKQNATWYPYDTTNPNKSITQWGWIRCHALQAWNEFNWNGNITDTVNPEYKEFCSSFMTASSWIDYTNRGIMAAYNADTFMNGAFSNMNDLISADVSGVNLSSKSFGDDLINLGDAVNLSKIDAFGLPSVLLATLGTNSAITKDLSFALLASGLETREIDGISSGTITNVTPDQEQQIYGAFLIITGDSLTEILSILQCQTAGLETLADLLNVKKMFPNSHNALTVPMYNGVTGLPTNSKTYYPIYQTGTVNDTLNTPEMEEYVGVQVPQGTPPVYKDRTLPEEYALPKQGFDSYLFNKIPEDQAVAAGALSFTLRQVRNIDSVDFKRFAKAAKSMENLDRLPLTAGTSKPTNQELLDNIGQKVALGSGPYGTYTFSDAFGCMSGLPYPWKLIKGRIGQLETDTLNNIYKELFLAVTWEEPTVEVEYDTYQVETSPGVFTTYYTVTGIIVTSPGGGYGRGDAPDPIITISNGGEGYGVVGRNDAEASSLGDGTFGRLLDAVLTDPGPDGTTVPTITSIEYPPVSTAGGTNSPDGTAGWQSTMDAVVQDYIDQANNEIEQILQNKPVEAKHLIAYWNIMGSQLAREQRTRYKALSPVAVPKDFFANPYPIMIETFVDALPQLSLNTAPHMSAQTIEAITNYATVGGQSTVGMMRQERNQVRLGRMGIPLDNNIPDQISDVDLKELTVNGTIPAADPGEGIPSPLFPDVEYTIPAWPSVVIDNEEVVPEPSGAYYSLPSDLTGQFVPTEQFTPGDITPILEGNPNPVVAPLVPVGPANTPEVEDRAVIIAPPSELDPTNVPDNLNIDYISSTLLPASPTVQQAIDQVIACNCDCWVK